MYICIFMYLHFTFLSCSILSIFSMFPITAGLFDLLPMHCIFTANFLKACKFLTNLIWKLGSHLLPLFTQLFYLAMHTFHLPAKQKKSAENSLILLQKQAAHANINCANIETQEILLIEIENLDGQKLANCGTISFCL